MISEQEVLESLDRLGEKIQSLRDENTQLKVEVDTLKNDTTAVELKKKYDGAMKALRHVVEETIEGKYEPLVEKLEKDNATLGERLLQLQNEKGDLLDKITALKSDIERLKAAADAKDKSLEAINNRLKSFSKAPSTELDIDSMITKIHNNDVKNSEVDKKLNEIKNERFTIQYEWGRATKETEKKFVEFVKELWKDYVVVGNYKVLNKIAQSKGDLDDGTLNTFLRFLLDKKLIENRDNGEVVSSAELERVIAVITKIC